MRLVDSQELPFDVRKFSAILEDKLVRRYKHIQTHFARRPKLVLANHFAALGVANVGHHVHVWSPMFELDEPRWERRERYDDQERTILVA